MGEIAEDYYTGHCCSGCMAYFKKPHGYPVLCKDCWDDATKSERRDYECATEEEI